ncbi:hypothetical protein D1007_16503 [Hordeum vulgare]|nr:hypothetical protein D1007_16503 [Hordeum vulgare]
MNPKRGSKPPRASEEAVASFSAQPQKQPVRRTTRRLFWNKTQSLIYSKIIKTRTNLFVDIKSIDMGHMVSNPHTSYFADAYALCEKWVLGPIVGFNKDFDIKVVAQFYATIHFHDGEERCLTWMTGGHVLHSDWVTFMTSLGVADKGLDETTRLRTHTEDIPDIHKSKLILYSRIVNTSVETVPSL